MSCSILCRLQAIVLSAACAANGAESPRAANRGDSIKALCDRLKVGAGSVIADVGCGDGPDSIVFAAAVGERGTVLAQEIDAAKLQKVLQAADKQGLHQIVPVLGQSDDPRLPDGFVDLLYMNRVFHHFSHPRDMLQRFAADLNPGGWLVIVDQHKGPLTDWVPAESREKQHHWTGETAVVRLAREAGFLFHASLDELWHEPQPFVLVFRKPKEPPAAAGDPDLPSVFEAKAFVEALPPAPVEGSAVVFVGLDRGRAAGPALRAALSPSRRFYDVVIDEWALSREELPPDPRAEGAEILRAEKNALALPGDGAIGLTVFADAYHRLWDPLPLLETIKKRMAGAALLAVMDREDPQKEPRPVAGHRRRISSELVIDELRRAGFNLRESLPPPAKDRFLLLFGLDQSPSQQRP